MSLLRKLSRSITGFDLLPRSSKHSVQQTAIDSVVTSTNVTPFSYSKTTKTYPKADVGGGAAMPMIPAAAGGRILGFHLNKHGYFTKGGGTSKWPQKITYHPAGTVWVRNRHRHVGNTRALRRSFSRVRGFAHLAMRTISFVKRHRLKGKKK